MSKMRLIVDSSCDMPDIFYKKYNIGVTDLIINLGEKVYRDRSEITAKDLLKAYDKTKVYPKTSALNIADLIDVFSKELKEYEHIFYLPISSQISSINNNAHLAASELKMESRITILDSSELSSGTALEAIGIGEDILAKLSPSQIEANHLQRKKRVSMSFVIDTMDFLYKGGRCSGLTYLLGNHFHLHPIIELKEGKMGVHKIARGKDINRGLSTMTDEFLLQFNKGNIDLNYPIFIPNVDSEGGVKHIKRTLEDQVGNKILFPIDASGIICCHCGRNTCGLAYMLKEPK